MATKSNYTYGHDAKTLATHSMRTAARCASHVIPHIRPTDHILDVGCGPGSITQDFARLATEGKVIGIDQAQSVVDVANQKSTEAGLKNLEFKQGNCYSLAFDSDTFDVVQCHQVLVHVDNPIQAFREMFRVCKPGGIVAAREGDWGGIILHCPRIPGFDRAFEPMKKLSEAGGGQPNAGRYLIGWALEIGFLRKNITIRASSDVFSTTEERAWAGTSYADRLAGTNGDDAVAKGACTEEERQQSVKALRAFALPEYEDAYMGILSNEIVCVKA